MKLSQIYPMIMQRALGYEGQFGTTNCDDVFHELRKLGIKEIEVTKDEMRAMVMFYIANAGQESYIIFDHEPTTAASNHQSQQTHTQPQSVQEVMREGKLDRFMGIDLIES